MLNHLSLSIKLIIGRLLNCELQAYSSYLVIDMENSQRVVLKIAHLNLLRLLIFVIFSLLHAEHWKPNGIELQFRRRFLPEVENIVFNVLRHISHDNVANLMH